ncbi:MAG: DNA polymerase [Elusimicrobia bacterium]|nr:DNA polymerase [Elusimicrobiota bacterium]
MTIRDPSQLVSWLYLDMNSFFASVEQEMNPALRGRPVAVVPLMSDSTCCIAVSYEGKAFGIKTGTNVGEAKRLCPQMKFIEGDHANYIRYHNKIVEAVESCVPVESVCSIDEMACRLTGYQQDMKVAEALAVKIKSTIKTTVGSSLKCSVGLGPNRYLAKIAGDMKKPDGFTVIRPCDLPGILYQLKLRDLPGVGARMEERLNKKGIFTMEKLVSMTAKELEQAWGSVCGEEIWHLLRGEQLQEKLSTQRSISHSHVLPPELRNKQGAMRILKKLTDKAATRLRQEGFFASGIQIHVRFIGADSWKARCTLMETQDTLAFIHAIKTLWKELPSGQVFAVGVAMTGLVPEAFHAPSLFEDQRRSKLIKTLDQLNEKFGKDVLHYGATHESAGLVPLRIAFTRIPDADEA